MFIIPIIGEAHAGRAFDFIPIRGWRTLYRPIKGVPYDAQLTAWLISGESMSGDRIHDGDYVIVHMTHDIPPNKILLLQTPDGMTVKRLEPDPEQENGVLLKSSNPTFEDIPWLAAEVTTIGVVKRVERDF